MGKKDNRGVNYLAGGRRLNPLSPRGERVGVMGAGGLLGKRQHIDAAGRAQRHGSAGVKHETKNQISVWIFCLYLTPHPMLRIALSP